MKELNLIDPEIAQLLEQESLRQKTDINLIASENYTHAAVLEATSSVLTNKYAEGYDRRAALRNVRRSIYV